MSDPPPSSSPASSGDLKMKPKAEPTLRDTHKLLRQSKADLAEAKGLLLIVILLLAFLIHLHWTNSTEPSTKSIESTSDDVEYTSIPFNGGLLKMGESLVSANGAYTARMQPDCNFVIYKSDSNKALWSTGTHQQTGACSLKAHGSLLSVVDPLHFNPTRWARWCEESKTFHVTEWSWFISNEGKLTGYSKDNRHRCVMK